MEKMKKMRYPLQSTCQAFKSHLNERNWKKEEEEKEREMAVMGDERMNSFEFIST